MFSLDSTLQPRESSTHLVMSQPKSTQNNSAKSLDKNALECREKSRSPRRISRLPADYGLQQWRLGSKRTCGSSSYVELLRMHEHTPASFKLYRDDEWLRGYPSRFTPFTKEALANPSPTLKLNVAVQCSALTHRISMLDEWALNEVKRQQAHLRLPLDVVARIQSKPSLFTCENRPPILDAKIYMDGCAKPTKIYINDVMQASANNALSELSANLPSWYDWQFIPLRAEVQPTLVWIACNSCKMGIEYKLVSLHVIRREQV